jgi:hypothetical protein
MPEHVLNFDLQRLSDRTLNLLIRGSLEHSGGSPVVRTVLNILTREQLRRAARTNCVRTQFLDLPDLATDQIRDRPGRGKPGTS